MCLVITPNLRTGKRNFTASTYDSLPIFIAPLQQTPCYLLILQDDLPLFSRKRLYRGQIHIKAEDSDVTCISVAQSVIRMSLDCSLKFACLNSTIASVCTSSCLVAAYRKTSVMRAVFVHGGHQDHGLTSLEQL